MSLLKRIQSSLLTFGQQGKDSFEYLGLTVRKGELVSYKVYENPTPRVEAELGKQLPYRMLLDKYFGRFAAASGVRICDVSESLLDGEDRYRLVFTLDRRLSHREKEQLLTYFFENLELPEICAAVRQDAAALAQSFDMGVWPLQQIGVETDVHAAIRVVKYYLDLTQDSGRRRACDRDFVDRLGSAFALNLEPQARSLLQIAQHRYRPVFVGINRDTENSERKLYFKSDAFGRQTEHVLPMSESLVELCGWERVVTKADLGALHKQGLYLEGIASTLERADEWRLYFAYLPRWRHSRV
ncbi:MAG: hypothetical protein QM296_04375 [Bacillota bacterium]|nr:hypothetical protein [Bacillota bacterium]